MESASPFRRQHRANRGQPCTSTPTAQTTKKRTKMTTAEVKAFADKVAEEATYTGKEVLTSEEVARYMGISLSYLYKLTMRRQIPHYKPLGKMCYFNRVEVEQWLQSNRVATEEELNERATAYCEKGGVR